jgi:PAS domain S-box-containing protein
MSEQSASSETLPPKMWSLKTCAALTALSYLALAYVSLFFVVHPENIAGFWLPNGFLVGLMIQRSRRDWPWLVASGASAAAVANLLSGDSMGVSLGLAAANLVEAWLASWLLVKYVGNSITLRRLKEVFGLVGVSAIPACVCGSFLGAFVVTVSSHSPAYWPVWRVWLVSDLLGILLMVPLMIAWHNSGSMSVQLLPLSRRIEALGLLTLLLLMTALVSVQSPGSVSSLFIRPYLIVPLMMWAAMRFGACGVTSATLAISLVAVWFVAQGQGVIPSLKGYATLQMLAIQLLLMVLALANLIMVAVVEDRSRSQEQLQLVIRGTDAGIWDWNLLTSEVYLSPRWKSMLGYEDHEIVNRFEAWESRVHPDDHGRVLSSVREFLASREMYYEGEHRLRHRDGRFLWTLARAIALRDSNGRAVRMAGSTLDISSLKQTELALRESESHFSAAFDDSPIGMDLVDRQGRYVRVNDAYCRMLGFTREQLLRKRVDDVTHPDDLARDRESMRQFQAGERRTYQVEKRYVNSEGHVVWALLSVTLVADANGQPLHYFGQAQDITRLKEDEEELRRQAQELARSDQELDDFAYIASHDLKTPLRGIENLSKWISEDSAEALSEASREHLRKLRQRIARLDRLLDDLLQYSRAGQQLGDVMPVQTGPLVRSVVELLTLPEGFVVTVDDNMPWLTTYKTPLELVFRNLIDNAVKHHDRTGGRIEVSAANQGRLVEFTIRDDGPGIPTEYHDLIFRMFQTLKPRDEVEGSGIGLAVVKKVVERQGGRVTVKPHNGRGTVFRFTWPNSVSPARERRNGHV